MTDSKQAADRRARVEQMRRAAAARERRIRLAITVVGSVVVVAIVAVIVFAFLAKEDKKTAQILPAPLPAGGAPTMQKPLKDVPDDSGIDGVKAYDTTAPATPAGAPAADPAAAPGIEHDHVEGPVTYVTTPPVGGPHSSVWSACGVYTAPIPSERAVHDLEHGAVWITYRPDLPSDQQSQLRDLATRQPGGEVTGIDGKKTPIPGDDNKYVVLSPWGDASLPSPVVISAWGRQLGVDTAGDPRLQRFIDAFRLQGKLTYEAGAACGGQPVSIGGRPDAT